MSSWQFLAFWADVGAPAGHSDFLDNTSRMTWTGLALPAKY